MIAKVSLQFARFRIRHSCVHRCATGLRSQRGSQQRLTMSVLAILVTASEFNPIACRILALLETGCICCLDERVWQFKCHLASEAAHPPVHFSLSNEICFADKLAFAPAVGCAQDLALPISPIASGTSTASPRNNPESTQPVVAILGSTGTGKSQLAVEIAQYLAGSHDATTGQASRSKLRGGSVISVDSMQMYRGLDVITNKATVSEQSEVPHHLMSFLGIEETYDVAHFVKEAREIAEKECIAQDRLPILAGGTTYYTQHLLFPGNVVKARGSKEADDAAPEHHPASGEDSAAPTLDTELQSALDQLSDDNRKTWEAITHTTANTSVKVMPAPRELWDLLNALDPRMALRWHPSDGRKITNSLRVIVSTGKRHSDWIAEQEAAASAGLQDVDSSHEESKGVVHWCGKPIRVLFFLLYAPRPVLNDRLNGRTGKMIERGLLREIQELRHLAAQKGSAEDLTKGIFQSIGYKEFKPFLDTLDAHRQASGINKSVDIDDVDVDALSGDLKRLFDQGLEEMKVATRQYAKKQLMWTKNKLLPEVRQRRSKGQQVEFVLLDTSEKDKWHEQVRGKALTALEAFLKGKDLPRDCWDTEAYRTEIAPIFDRDEAKLAADASEDLPASLAANAHNVCATCTAAAPQGVPVYVRQAEAERHKNGKIHRRSVAWAKKQARLQSGEGLADKEEDAERKRQERAARRSQLAAQKAALNEN